MAFACAFYARDGVARLPGVAETLNVDVNILLFAIYARLARGIALDAADLRHCRCAGARLASRGRSALRALRTRLKAGPVPAPSAATDPLRNRIKATELEAEQIELALLCRWLDRQPPRPAASTDAASMPLRVARHFGAPGDGALPREADDALAALTRALSTFAWRAA